VFKDAEKLTSNCRSEIQERLTVATAGQLCSQVWLGYGSVLFLGFGDSVLVRTDTNAGHPVPEHELQAFEAEWIFHQDNIRIARFNDVENPDRIATALTLTRAFVGQSVMEATVLSNHLDVLIRFGHGASLMVEPPDDADSRDDVAWLLRYPSGVHYTVLCDGRLTERF